MDGTGLEFSGVIRQQLVSPVRLDGDIVRVHSLGCPVSVGCRFALLITDCSLLLSVSNTLSRSQVTLIFFIIGLIYFVKIQSGQRT